ncbi:hypothetical protein DSCA_09620 [Desulfosarcina alkanivorans]|uniref:Uncharacterized protein n=1 Tax=Desulfosarcina alkanivorans TaxID=571177 RepID=A0A5K7YC88_9BACT|nr:hypothetical protein DSCA_09620 [Desulfosarcina alkanivorans]
MVSAKMIGYLSGPRRFIVTFFFKADTKGFYRRPVHFLHQRDDYGRINASTEQSTQWDVANQSVGNRLR